MGLGHLAKTAVIEELSRLSGAMGAMGAMAQASQLGVAKVAHFGTERQKARWRPSFASGELLPTIAVTEPESGGHVLSYVLNGRNCFVGNSHIGDVHGFGELADPGADRGLGHLCIAERERGRSVNGVGR